MKRQPEETMLQHRNFKIIKTYDHWGYWEYVLLRDNAFFARSSSFERLKNIACAKTEVINGVQWLYNDSEQHVDGKRRKVKRYLTTAFSNDFYGVQFAGGVGFGGMKGAI